MKQVYFSDTSTMNQTHPPYPPTLFHISEMFQKLNTDGIKLILGILKFTES